MKIICKECAFSVSIAAERIPSKGAKVRCPKCGHLFKIFPPETETADLPLLKQGNPKENESLLRPEGPVKLYWLQCGGCGGDTWAFFNSDPPDTYDFFSNHHVELLWHPSVSHISAGDLHRLNKNLISGKEKLDILCIEGSAIRGPGGTGMFDTVLGKPKKDLLYALARQATYVLAIGTCASFGGIGGDSEIEATGMQFHKWEAGGFLGKDFRTRSGLPVINLPGCPCHGSVTGGALSALVSGLSLTLDKYNEPLEWYDTMVHQGCTRNEYHEYRVEEKKFGEKGCLFFYLGCHGPLVYGPCNKLLWNRRSSKTRVGVPCFGCTRPDFPQQYPFFRTRNIEGIPIELPDGVNRAHYLAYKGIAAAAAPKRLRNRITGI
ncbi:MAG: zinc-ribbon domain-containing protein [Desulfococcaceae bacterium]|jgi:hydrogenase small subunit|nr:zinc-ribbon domain-containing protein [Desulfococcaceae bacterium]